MVFCWGTGSDTILSLSWLCQLPFKKKIMLLTNPLGPFRVDSNSSNNFVLSLSYFFELIVYLVNFEGLLYKCKNFDLA